MLKKLVTVTRSGSIESEHYGVGAIVNSVNFAGEHPIHTNLSLENVNLIELPEKSLKEVIGNITPEQAFWDSENHKVIQNPIYISDSLITK